MLIGARGEGRPGLDMTGGTSGGRPGLSSQLCKMKDISSSVAPLLSTLYSAVWQFRNCIFKSLFCLFEYLPTTVYVCGMWSLLWSVFGIFTFSSTCLLLRMTEVVFG